MSTTDRGPEFTPKITYTFDEAIEYMKHRNKFPTYKTITWKNARTGKSVCIGNTSSSI